MTVPLCLDEIDIRTKYPRKSIDIFKIFFMCLLNPHAWSPMLGTLLEFWYICSCPGQSSLSWRDQCRSACLLLSESLLFREWLFVSLLKHTRRMGHSNFSYYSSQSCRIPWLELWHWATYMKGNSNIFFGKWKAGFSILWEVSSIMCPSK